MEVEIIEFQDKRWQVKRKMPDEAISADVLELIKKHRNASVVLKRDGVLYFVDEISIATFEELI